MPNSYPSAISESRPPLPAPQADPQWALATGRRHEQGYALLMVIFLVALVMIGLASAIPDVMQQGRREKEAEMIYRGNQYERGVKLYYKKMGKYPQALDDITKEQNGIHFMRKAYKDPMNPEDGSWRLIYVTSTGQLINSLLYTSLQDMVAKLRPNSGISFGAPPGGTPVPGQGIPGLSSSPGSSTGLGSGFGSNSGSGFGSGGSSGFGGSGFGSSGGFGSSQQGSPPQSGSQGGTGPGGSNLGGAGPAGPTNSTYQPGGGLPGAGQPGGTGQYGQPGGFGAPGSGSPNGTSGDQSSSAGTDASDSDSSGQVFGGNLTGVASKIDKPSIKVFQTGKTYKKWEFIWNPQLDIAAAAPGGRPTPQGLNGAPGQPPGVAGPGSFLGGQPGAGGAPTPPTP